MPAKKKNGEIRLCVDFRNLNKLSLKDNYPLPKMDQLLQRVIGYDMISMLNDFCGYNHILFSQEDREKKTFTTPWGTFLYAKINFVLINAGATFHRTIDLAFVGKVNKIKVIYLDDLRVFLETDAKHIKHLRKVFQRCIKFGISLNPKKSLFAMREGKLFGNIISK